MRFRKELIKSTLVALLFATCFVAASDTGRAQRARRTTRAPRGERPQRALYTNPAIAGDYPDPSVIRVGQDYYAAATSSEWAPEFPLLHSRDLVNWRIAGAVFQRRPAWSIGNYWAPEMHEDRGRFYIYYTARKKPEAGQREGRLCVAVATAARPLGPYTDHGPLVCQEVGSIDGFPVRDEEGRRYLLWKEDGNSVSKPTPIWAQQLSENGTRLIGERREIMRNDQPWEKHATLTFGDLVEGPSVVRRDGWFYMFYSGNFCCGRECNYALGVARSRKLLGPWEKNPANPILASNEVWRCPGHGTVVSDGRGRNFLMYHAYDARDSVYVGRQALLDEVVWNGTAGWPTINAGRGPSEQAAAPLRVPERNAEYNFADEFTTTRLQAGWQWPQANEPVIRIDTSRGGRLLLAPAQSSDLLGGVIGWWMTVGDYTATTAIDVRSATRGALAGLSAYGDNENALGVGLRDGQVVLWRREKNVDSNISQTILPARTVRAIYLQMTAHGGNRFRFAFSTDGRNYTNIGEEVDGSYLPPWDRGVRVALTVGGAPRASAAFERLSIVPSGSTNGASRAVAAQ